MKNRFVPVLAIMMVAASVSTVRADVGVNFKAGTLGLGAELTKSFGEKFSVGLGFNSFDIETTDSASDIDYDFDFELQSAALLANYHPFGGVFRVTAGALYNKNELKLTSKPTGSNYVINGQTYTAAQVGTLNGTLTFDKTAPYLGLGWGNRPGSRVGVSFDIGALYQGSPSLSLSATGALSDPSLAANLEQERRSAEEDLSDFKWYPVVSLGVYFSF